MTDLKNACTKEMEKLSDIILTYPWEDRWAYANWLAQTFYMVNYSTRLVALAGACCTIEQNDFHHRFIDHSREERGHEKIAISDIKELGFTLDDFPQTYQSAAMYQVQYFWVQHRSPLSFFGYTLALERVATDFGPEILKRIFAAHPAKACKFLKLHVEDDADHTESAYKRMALLTPPEQELVRENMELSCALYRGMFEEMVRMLGARKIRKAA